MQELRDTNHRAAQLVSSRIEELHQHMRSQLARSTAYHMIFRGRRDTNYFLLFIATVTARRANTRSIVHTTILTIVVIIIIITTVQWIQLSSHTILHIGCTAIACTLCICDYSSCHLFAISVAHSGGGSTSCCFCFIRYCWIRLLLYGRPLFPFEHREGTQQLLFRHALIQSMAGVQRGNPPSSCRIVIITITIIVVFHSLHPHLLLLPYLPSISTQVECMREIEQFPVR
mmetsp:Transcript_2062/g.3242  ORF Transcript_2062/g.3242 Transcript_2062/m.3242 type:complete len:230 (-) Transcript_2062:2361-3050(-)